MQLAASLLALSLLGTDPRSETRPFDARERYGDAVARIVDEALSSNRSIDKLTRLIDVAPMRLAGSPGAQKAVEWARGEMQACGLSNVRLEPCKEPRWVRGDVQRLRVTSPEQFAAVSLPIVALGGSVATPAEGLRARVVEVTSLEELASLGEQARGKLVFFNQPMDRRERDVFEAYGKAVWQRSRGAIEAAKVGAVGALVRSMSLRIDELPHTGAMRYDESLAKVPAAALATAAAERLAGMLASSKDLEVELALDCKTLDDVDGANVVGEILGVEHPDQIVLIGAHLDAWDVGVGAHDDGAGCVHVLEAMHLLKRLSLKPRRTIRAVLFANEENGLRGAFAYAKSHESEHEKHVFAIESDRGGFVPRGFGVKPPAFREMAAPLVALLEPIGAGLLVDGDGGADLWPLQDTSIPLGELLPDGARYFDIHHCDRDRLDQVNERELALGAAALAAFAYMIADAPFDWPRRELPATK